MHNPGKAPSRRPSLCGRVHSREQMTSASTCRCALVPVQPARERVGQRCPRRPAVSVQPARSVARLRERDSLLAHGRHGLSPPTHQLARPGSFRSALRPGQRTGRPHSGPVRRRSIHVPSRASLVRRYRLRATDQCHQFRSQAQQVRQRRPSRRGRCPRLLHHRRHSNLVTPSTCTHL